MSYRLFGLPMAVILAGCQTSVLPQAGSLDAGFGETVKYNAAIQVIDPDPVYVDGGSQPGDRGDKGAEAVKRYRTDQVKEVESEATTSSTGGSSGPQ